MLLRLSKIALVIAIASFATLVVYNNIAQYDINFSFIYTAIHSQQGFMLADVAPNQLQTPLLLRGSYIIVIALEVLTTLICWLGAFVLLRYLKASSEDFNEHKTLAVVGLTSVFMVCQIGFKTIGHEWLGCWFFAKFNGVPYAYHFWIATIIALIYLSWPEKEA